MTTRQKYCAIYTPKLEEIETWWGFVLPWVRAACFHNPHHERPDKFRSLIDRHVGLLQIIVCDDKAVGCLILEIVQDCLHVSVMSGQRGLMLYIEHVVNEMDALAKHLGLKYVTGVGRKGWRRALAKYGVEYQGENKYRRAVT